MKHLLILSSLLCFNFNILAEVDTADLALADESIDSPTLNIEGKYKEKEVPVNEVAPKVERHVPVKKLSQSDKIRLYREKLELRNQIMVQKKMEQIRLKQELALAKKLEQSMNQTIQAIDLQSK